MSILMDNTTRVIVQGITGREGQFHTRNMKAAGTNIVGGTTPGKGGQMVEGVPVFDTVAQARAATDANASCIFVPGPGAADAIMEAARAGIGQSTCIGIGGDPIIGSTFSDYLKLFESDPQTKAVVMCGEIGGSDEEDAAEYIKTMSKPVVAFISGRTAPPGKRKI